MLLTIYVNNRVLLLRNYQPIAPQKFDVLKTKYLPIEVKLLKGKLC